MPTLSKERILAQLDEIANQKGLRATADFYEYVAKTYPDLRQWMKGYPKDGGFNDVPGILAHYRYAASTMVADAAVTEPEPAAKVIGATNLRNYVLGLPESSQRDALLVLIDRAEFQGLI